ncbi:MAG TPA: hypothetical protein VGC64_09665 [Pyrinomonadaceae bacterium]|jgi:hypothetical protein
MKDRRMAVLRKVLYALSCVLVVASLRLWPAGALACACCAEPGTWYERTDRIDEYQWTELNRLRFDAVANVYAEAGEDAVKGISNPADEYTLTLSKQPRRWDLKYRDKQGRAGTLSLTIPTTAVQFGVDMHDAPQGAETQLYKEVRLTGALTGTGIFKGGSTPQTKFRLILQGRGNNCMAAEDFKNWTLQIFGPRASYTFYGSLKEPAPPKS